MLNLLEKLSDKDNKILENYIHNYGIKHNYIGNSEYLREWSFNKPRLYRLLGEKLIHKVPFKYEKPKTILRMELTELLDTDFPFTFIQRLDNLCKDKKILSNNEQRAIENVLNVPNLIEDKVLFSIKFKIPSQKKMIQIQAGMKPMRALQKLYKYFGWDDLDNAYEKFRIKHSLILNEKFIKSNLCFSIMPMDFLTMSDNDNGWSSCMSWTEDGGGYRVGTVEMMNSNNVICCYLESSSQYHFTDDENGVWNNKRWRQLVYVTNDIIVTGKAYPYQNEEISLKIVEVLRDLAEKNLGKTYEFGPELYKDMIHISSLSRMNKNHAWLRRGPHKHNIIFETNGMYNDMLNDSDTKYYCVRNKVKKMKIVSVSGKAPCLCCGENLIYQEENYDNYDDDYNERYLNCNRVVCRSCHDKLKCSICNRMYDEETVHTIEGKKICLDCYLSGYVCPDCGSPFTLDIVYSNDLFMKIDKFDVPLDRESLKEVTVRGKESFNGIVKYYACNTCINNKRMGAKYHKQIKKYNFPLTFSGIALEDTYEFLTDKDGSIFLNEKHEWVKKHMLGNLVKMSKIQTE